MEHSPGNRASWVPLLPLLIACLFHSCAEHDQVPATPDTRAALLEKARSLIHAAPDDLWANVDRYKYQEDGTPWPEGRMAIAEALLHDASSRTAGRMDSLYRDRTQHPLMALHHAVCSCAEILLHQRDHAAAERCAGELLERLDLDTLARAKAMSTYAWAIAERSAPMEIEPLVELRKEQLRDERCIADLVAAKAWAHLNLGELHMAQITHEEAIEKARALNDRHMLAKCLTGMAFTKVDQGDHAGASANFKEADQLYERSNDQRCRVATLDGLAYTYWGLLDEQEVLDIWHKALAIADSLKMDRRRAMVRLNLARFHIGLDSMALARLELTSAQRYDLSVVLLDTAAAIAERYNDLHLLAGTLKIQCASHNRQGRPERSIQLAQDALKLFKDRKEPLWTQATLVDIASNQIAMQRWYDAIATLREAQEIALHNGYSEGRMFIHNRLYFAYKQLAQFDSALVHLEQRHILKDSLEGLEVVDKLAQQALRHAFEKRQYADSLLHEQQLMQERLNAETAVRNERDRMQTMAGSGAVLLLGSTLVYALDRRRRRERFEKEAALLETKALRSQMDPHFIFNALNSISAFIHEKRPQEAHAFIARFGKLTRLVLENSRCAEVSLNNELEFLRTYLELEQARTRHAFTFTISLDAGIDPKTIAIPPMIVQPFVENAIWHGLGEMTEGGRIEVHIRSKESELVISIIDNGRGISSSDRQADSRRSLGTRITRERLEILSRRSGRTAYFNYPKTASGTCVAIHLPFQPMADDLLNA